MASTGGERPPRAGRRPSSPRPSATRSIAHARAEYPNEACGLIVGDAPGGGRRPGAPLRGRPATRPRRRTATRSTRTTCYRLTVETDDADEVFWGIVHSHTHTPAVPSPTDIGLAFYPDALYLLVSLAEDQADPATAEPGVRAWRIVDGEVHEVALG